MKLDRTLFIAAVIAGLMLIAGAPMVAANSHEHAAAEPPTLALNHGSKWATDAPLQKYMAEIRAAIAAQQVGIKKGTLLPDDYAALGSLIEKRVVSIVSECKLDPAADANFHLIVAELLDGAATMQGKSKSAPSSGAAVAINAMNEYGQFFDHPGWEPLR